VVIHIAGTNGKGSVALKVANTLQAHGLNVGLFCSPHVSSFRERMQFNGEIISEEEVVELLPQIYTMCLEHDIPATFFEITTALAFMFYAQRKVQVVVLETGLGGRLDATNVITNPAMSVITSIGLEHTRILGDTIELIAREKGGIIKPGRPVLCGPHVPHEVLRECTTAIGGGKYYTPDVVLGTHEDMLITDYDEENQRISKAALVLLQDLHPELVTNLTQEEMDAGVLIRPPCRFELVPRDDDLTVILDVAHNPPAMEYLVRKLKKTFPDATYRFVVGMSSDKDLGQCGRSILAVTDPSRIHLVEAQHPRAAKLEAILNAEPRLKACHVDLEDRSITKQVLSALALAKEQPGEILVVCGSVFLMAEARESLGFDEPRDSDAIAEVAGAGTRNTQENFGNTTGLDTKEK
jgi:dihydrofolate synthase/folylpolyglutamate synthase